MLGINGAEQGDLSGSVRYPFSDWDSFMIQPLDELINTHQQALEARDPSSRFCVLNTVDKNGYPASRVLTVRSIEQTGITLYVDQHSPKVLQLQSNPKFELLFFWPTLMKQYRVRGKFQIMKNPDQATEWINKPYAGRLVDLYHSVGRKQSSSVDSLKTVQSELAALAAQYPDQQLTEIPDGLVTLLVKPTHIGAWINMQEDRIHDRREYSLMDGSWQEQVLVP
ncbi:MAG: pyridoxamine 5'-phosphate oxidase family protein [Pseudomonadales bacterium]|nr:pyridoxamine 5'-phosphate oxidase family protein [Pseudomonadales bacterium]